MAIDQTKLQAFMARFAADQAAAMHAATVVLGDEVGLYRAMADGGPQSFAELASRTGCQPRLVREWLNAQTVSGYCEYDPASGRYWLSAEQAACLADPASPTFVAGGALLASSVHKDTEQVRRAFTGDGALGWGEHHPDLFTGTDRFFGPVYRANLVPNWIPALDAVEDKLRTGALAADIGCGQGAARDRDCFGRLRAWSRGGHRLARDRDVDLAGGAPVGRPPGRGFAASALRGRGDPGEPVARSGRMGHASGRVRGCRARDRAPIR